jgi:pantoate--beta-alanine ligase
VKTVSTISDVRAWRRAAIGSVGLVPTMGYLHQGHLSLVTAARRENERVAATLFVNPTQFGPSEDFARYPRDLGRDQALLEAAGCDLLFAPTVDQMYPRGAETTIEVGSVAAPLEGERRPGHFRGVATVVMKLLQIATPDRAYFGEKDAQQLAVIRRLVVDLDVPVEIRGCPVVREPDGLAMSSRNTYLSSAERHAASVLFRAFERASALWHTGERRAAVLQRGMEETIAKEPLARLDYAAVGDPVTFRAIATASGAVRLVLAVHFGRTRLIDSALLPDARSAGILP